MILWRTVFEKRSWEPHIVVCASGALWGDSIKPFFFSPLRVPIARRGVLASQLQFSHSRFSLQPAVSLESSSKLERVNHGVGVIGGGAGLKEVKCFSQNVLTHDQETTRLVETFPSLCPRIKRGTGSGSAKSPFCCWLDPCASEALWVNSPSRCCHPRSHFLFARRWPQRWVEVSCCLSLASFFWQRLPSDCTLWFFRNHRLLAFYPFPTGYCLVLRACVKHQILKLLPMPVSPDQQMSITWASTEMNFLYLSHQNHNPFSQVAILLFVQYKNILDQEFWNSIPIPIVSRCKVRIIVFL